MAQPDNCSDLDYRDLVPAVATQFPESGSQFIEQPRWNTTRDWHTPVWPESITVAAVAAVLVQRVRAQSRAVPRP